jgi:Co/Zn/Cd efflux system component
MVERRMTESNQGEERRVLMIALSLNATMFVVGIVAGMLAKSTGLIADSLDMLADAGASYIAMVAIRRGGLFKARAATVSGTLLLMLGIGVLGEAIYRGLLQTAPRTGIMLAVAFLSLTVNSTVLYQLGKFRRQAVHMRATWIFTRADVIANIAVILSAMAISLTRLNLLDTIVGGGSVSTSAKRRGRFCEKPVKLLRLKSDNRILVCRLQGSNFLFNDEIFDSLSDTVADRTYLL